MGSLGTPEILVILVVALLVFGPKRLPELGKSLGKAVREFKRATFEIQNTLEREVEDLKREDAPEKREPPSGQLPGDLNQKS